ncbi:MAG: pyridoxal-dependent decarboxylase [Planctomycetes bacterium]|nr:pyridoxal-dependent decarboxylase [Planctomycetota bacterium]
MDSLVDRIERLLATLAEGGGAPAVDPGRPGAIRSQLAEHFEFQQPVAREDLLRAAAALLRATSAQGDHSQYFGSIAGGSRDATLAAAAFEAGLGVLPVSWELAPGVAELEGLLMSYLVEVIGMDAQRTVARVCETGEEAQLAALIAAATQCFPDFEQQGVQAVDGRPLIYCAQSIVGPWQKRAHAAGLGRGAVQGVACDASGCIDPIALRHQIIEAGRAGNTPFFIAAGAGAASTGAIDPIKKLVAVGRVQGMWVHVDGNGLGLGIFSNRLAPLLDGSAYVDSFACETRGGLPAAGSAGFLFCRHLRPVGHAFAVEDPRLPGMTAGAAEARASGLLGARRAAALPFLLWLAQHGHAGYAEIIDRLCVRADELRSALLEAGCQVRGSEEVPVVCFLPPLLETHADFEGLASRIRAQSIAWVDAVCLPDGAPALRAWVSSPSTGPSEIAALVEAVTASD